MRFTPFLVAALGFTSASAAVLEQRALLDLCANVVGQLNIRLPILGLVSLGQVNICLCVSALPLYIRTDIVGRAIVKLLGSEVDATARLNTLVRTQVPYFRVTPDISLCLRSDRSAATASIPLMQSLSALPVIPVASNVVKATSAKAPTVSALQTRRSAMASASRLVPFADPWVLLHAVSRLGWMPNAGTVRRFVVYKVTG